MFRNYLLCLTAKFNPVLKSLRYEFYLIYLHIFLNFHYKPHKKSYLCGETVIIMETKLTLSIESDLAQTVKKYAKKKGYTLSNLVENYFLLLIKNEETSEVPLSDVPLASSLLGSLRTPDKTNYKEELTNSLIEKYL